MFEPVFAGATLPGGHRRYLFVELLTTVNSESVTGNPVITSEVVGYLKSVTLCRFAKRVPGLVASSSRRVTGVSVCP
jgi:hypothetical protein